MTRDPYTVLGLTPDANNDEVKAAYRKLAKQYHPDLNPGSTEAEKKMKEINEAYDIIVNGRYEPGSYGAKSAGAQSSGYGSSGYGFSGFGSGFGYSQGGSSGAYRRGYADPNEGFWGNPYGFTGRASAKNGYESSQIRAARNYINSRHYYEALNVLETISDRDAYWYYLSALASEGVDNHINAVEHARMASQMEPDNQEYADLLERFEYAGGAAGNYARHFTMPRGGWSAMLWCLLINLCCGRGCC